MKKKAALFAALLLAVLMVIVPGAGCSKPEATTDAPETTQLQTETAAEEEEDVFSLWEDGAPAMNALIDYVESVTKEGSPDYIPVEDRIAVFDMDGTLMGELYPTYLEYYMLAWRILKDPNIDPDTEMLKVGRLLRDCALDNSFPSDMPMQHAIQAARAYAGMTMNEFADFVTQILLRNVDGFEGMTYGESFYLPMVELVKYLCDNGFIIYVISGTERTTTRAIVANSPIADYVTPEHVIGTDFEVKQKGHEDESSNMDYKYENGDELVLTGGFVQKNLNCNKSIYIEREIGRRPVLAFGNSGSDTSMMNYTIDDRNPYPAQAYMIVADDDVREWGTQNWEEKSAEYAAKGFIPVSMKNDFAAIYPEGIVKAKQQYAPAAGEEVETTRKAA